VFSNSITNPSKKLPVTFWLGFRLVLGDGLVLADGVEVRGYG
jgi:hypothetical protein